MLTKSNLTVANAGLELGVGRAGIKKPLLADYLDLAPSAVFLNCYGRVVEVNFPKYICMTGLYAVISMTVEFC